MSSPNAPKPGHTAVVTFGRPITDEDLQRLQSDTDAVEARLAPIDVDSDHVHTVNE